MTFSRKEQLTNLEKESIYDLLVIGGGVVGSATLAMASSEGLNSILLEKNDFASGASSRSTKLLHGGIRYLPQLQFRLVRESLQEQKILDNLLGKLYKPLQLLAPIYRNDGFADIPKNFSKQFFCSKSL
jgi:glycerol-3-phosphate dehydrogenase